jgi:hypothetical protein
MGGRASRISERPNGLQNDPAGILDRIQAFVFGLARAFWHVQSSPASVGSVKATIFRDFQIDPLPPKP